MYQEFCCYDRFSTVGHHEHVNGANGEIFSMAGLILNISCSAEVNQGGASNVDVSHRQCSLRRRQRPPGYRIPNG